MDPRPCPARPASRPRAPARRRPCPRRPAARSSRCPGSGAGRASSACPAPRTPRPAGRPRPARCCSDAARSGSSADRTPPPAARSARCPTGRDPSDSSRSSKSPAFRATMPRPASCSVPSISLSWASPTSEQSLAAATAATSASRTWGVRSHTPPGQRHPSSRRPCAPRPPPPHRGRARARPWDPAMVPPASRMPFAGTATPSSSMSSAATV